MNSNLWILRVLQKPLLHLQYLRHILGTLFCISIHRLNTELVKEQMSTCLFQTAQNILERYCALGWSSNETVFAHVTFYSLHRASVSLEKPQIVFPIAN